MKVEELIKLLQKMQQDKPIYGMWQEKKVFFPDFDIVETNDFIVLYCNEEFDEH